MRWLKLSLAHKTEPVWVNMDLVELIRTSGDGGSVLEMTNGSKVVHARESPDMIQGLLQGEAPKATPPEPQSGRDEQAEPRQPARSRPEGEDWIAT